MEAGECSSNLSLATTDDFVARHLRIPPATHQQAGFPAIAFVL